MAADAGAAADAHVPTLFTEALIGLAVLASRVRVEPTQEELPLKIPFTLTVDGPIRARVRPQS